MRHNATLSTNLPPEQQAIRDKCFHPSGTFVEFPMEDVETSIPARFEKIVRLYPQRVAIKDNKSVITYAQLNRMANQVAHGLLGVRGSNMEPVGLLLGNAVAFIASILGVLKAGKFFIPLDPLVSLARNGACLEDAHARLLLADKENIGAAKQLALNGPRLVEFETFEKEASTQPVLKSPSPLMLAYIAYTSGSTGEPKGVMVDHRYLLHDVRLRTNAYHISHHDRLSLIAAGSVHALNNIFFALLNGANLLPFNVRREGVLRFAGWLLREQITICRITIQLFRELCSALIGREKFQDLRLIQFAGDSRFPSDVEKWGKCFPSSCLLANGISSSETGYLTDFLVDHATKLESEMMPAGYTVENKELLLLDDNGEPVGFNQVGEIVVKSAFISPGYWRRPELNRTNFRPSSSDDDSRMFFTGDLALRMPDGCIVYKGRKDFRVKIRGYNIEPTHIENALRQHQCIKHAGVLACGGNEHDPYLAAYVVPKGEAPSADELRIFLNELLPHYMIPSAFVFLESLPLTNGKIDRNALPEPDDKRPKLRIPYAEATNETEKTLVGLWEDAMEVRPIGIYDDFFDLGGHSLTASRVISAVQAAFGVELSMKDLLGAPTVAGLAELIRLIQSSVTKEPELENYLRPLIKAANRDAEIPLSYAEEGLWLIEQISPGQSGWNMQSQLRLRGALNVEALERSFNALIERHETLRTAYRLVDGEPRRAILPTLAVEVPIVRLDSSVDAKTEIDRLSVAERTQLFDLTEAPLFRARLLRVGEQDHVLIVTAHHIITDAWSNNVFSRELFALYEAYSNGEPSPLAVLPVQYSDYAVWVRQAKQDADAKNLAYWRERLNGYVVTELPSDKLRQLKRSYDGGHARIQLSQDCSRALRELCKTEHATIFMLLVAAFKILLSRHSGSMDVIVGSTLAGRRRAELDNLIGVFINILTLRTDLSGRPTFREVLRRVRNTCLEAYEHQDMPFEKLVEELNPGRGLSRNPFFQVLFNVANLPPIPVEAAGLSIERLSRPEDAARFDLTLYAPQTRDNLEIRVAYNHNLFSQDYITEVLEQYKHLLEQIVENPDQPIDQYSLITPMAKGLLPDPTAKLDDTWYGSVHELFTRNARERPEKIAVADSLGSWSFTELHDRSNQLANCLLANNVHREDIVAVYGQRSATLVCALLGVLKAGAAFCVIDPSHPPLRVKEYLSAIKPRASIEIVTTPTANPETDQVLNDAGLDCRVRLQATAGNEPWPFLTSHPTDDPPVGVSADDLAYVIFTSGSTGKPKGVMGRHGPLTHFLPWLTESFGISENDRFSFLSSVSTNKLQREIFTALSVGGSLYIPSDDDIGSFGKLDQWLRVNEISVVHLTPAMMQLLDETAREPIPSVQSVFFGGDLLRMRDVNRARKLMPEAKIVNFYNSSETQRGGGHFVFSEHGLNGEKDTPPLGKGVKDVQLLILNSIGKLAGVGELGEICVRSPHLARGYLDDDQLTKERFITNPFTGIAEDRIYRTGEQGRYLATGDVEFVARRQNQFSIRGFRVELSEIESALSDHPGIDQAVVEGRESPTETLVAYFSVKKEQAVTAPELRNFLRAKLPRHMIPAHFAPVESLPLTATGKVDRVALATKIDFHPESNNEYVAPRNDLERSLCSLWSEVLGVERVGIDDDFFDLGGHSLLAAKLFRRLDEELGWHLPLSSLFAAPTVRLLTERYESLKRKHDHRALVALRPSGSLPPVFAVPGVFGNVVGYAELSRALGPDQPFYGLQSVGLDGRDAPLDTIEAMAGLYVEEIRLVRPHGPYAILGACFGATVAYEIARQLLDQGEDDSFSGVIGSDAARALWESKTKL